MTRGLALGWYTLPTRFCSTSLALALARTTAVGLGLRGLGLGAGILVVMFLMKLAAIFLLRAFFSARFLEAFQNREPGPSSDPQ